MRSLPLLPALLSVFFASGAVANPPLPGKYHARSPSHETPMEVRQVEDRPSAAPATRAEKSEEFNPYVYSYALGLEGPALTGTSPLKETALALGIWMDRNLGFEFYGGYTRTGDTDTATTAVATNAIANTSTLTTNYTGTANLSQIILGGAIKYRIHQRRHFGVSVDFLFTVNPGAASTYQTGTHVESTPDITAPTTYSVTDTNLGTVNVGLSPTFRLGPRATVDYYLPWLPNLLIGATFGVYTSIGGGTTTTTSTRSRTYNVTAGVAGAPGTDSTSTTTAILSPGPLSNTYGLGGTGVGIGTGAGLSPLVVVGTFRIRYAF